jgi:outer membrane immunogenic protein
MTYKTRLTALVMLAATCGVASAQGLVVTTPGPTWTGFYAGVNAGGAWDTTCNTWTANGPGADTAAFNNRDCPNNGIGVGGVQVGYNFQHEQWVWGFELDYDFWSSKDRNRSLTYNGIAVPDGTYSFNGKLTPDGVFIVGPRVGYAVGNWLPYVRVGGVFTSGSHDVMANYTPPGGSSPTATFNGGKNTSSHGFGISAGAEYKLAQQWSLKAEYTYIKLGKNDRNSTTSCTGTPAACDAFAEATIDSIHNSFTASILRVGVNYAF